MSLLDRRLSRLEALPEFACRRCGPVTLVPLWGETLPPPPPPPCAGCGKPPDIEFLYIRVVPDRVPS